MDRAMRRLPGWLGLLLLAALVSVSGPGVAAKNEVRDPNPLPPDPKVSDCPSTGRYGGRFVLGATSAPKTFNALVANETSSTNVTNRLFSFLDSFNNETQKVEPDLAKSWERSRDGRTYTFHLRHARFSDGSPITSADVLFAFQVMYDPKVHPVNAELLKVGGKPFDITAPDDYTVVFRLPGTYGLFLSAVGSVAIMPKARLSAALRDGKFESMYGVGSMPEEIVGSGAWRLKQYVPNEKVVLERNPFYYEVDRKNHRLPYLDELVWVVVGNQDGELLKFESGETDGIDEPRPTDFTRLQKGQHAGHYKLYELGVTLNTTCLWFNLNVKPDLRTPFVDAVKYRWFSDPNFRRAVAMGISQSKMIRLAFQGQAVPNFGISTRGNKAWFDPNVKEYSYDPDRAKSLLARGGFADRNHDGWLEDASGNKVQFTLITNAGNTYREAMCNLVKADLKKIGMDVTVAPIDFNLMVGKLREQRDYEAALLGFQTGVPPDPAMAQNVWKSSGKTHFWNTEQPHPTTPWEAQIDSLMDELVRLDDYPKRKRLWDRVQEIVSDQEPLIYLPSQKAYAVARENFGNLRPTSIAHRLLWNAPQIYAKK